MNLKTNLANRSNYGNSRPTSNIKYIVIHYTANDGDTDENNGKYFKNNVVKVSAHYFVDDDSVTRSVPDNYIAYHCGTSKGYKHSYCRNANSIGIEICDDIKNGIIYPSKKTIDNTIELVESLMKKYNIPKSNVIRHYDVTGKLCPAYWCGNATKNNMWKTEFWNKIGASASSTPTPTPTTQQRGSVLTAKTAAGVYASPTKSSAKSATMVAGQQYYYTSVYTGGDKVKWYLVTVGNARGWVCQSDITLGNAVTTNVTTNKIDTVKEVQNWANKNYNSGLRVDGSYGLKTKRALIKILQTELNQTYKTKLAVDGSFGSKTKNACPSLKSGTKNDVVGVLQAFLICNGYKSAYLDKSYGSATISAVKSYQKSKGLVADGVAGKNTFAKLCN